MARQEEDEKDEAQAERRGYFRIDDRLYLEYRVLPGDEGPAQEPTMPSHLKLVSELSGVSRQAQGLLSKLRETDAELAQYLALLNRKVDLLAALVLSERRPDPIYANHTVTLSAGGLAFDSEERIEPGTRLALCLVLFPSYTAMALHAEVVRCDPRPEPQAERPYRIAVEFSHLRDPDRDAIIRHMLERQSAQIRQARGVAKGG